MTLNLINSGKIKAIAVAATERLPNAGNIPTFAEAGLPFIVNSWIGMLAPPNTPPAIVDKLNRTAIEAMSLAETRAAFEKSSLLLGGGSPADFARRSPTTGRWRRRSASSRSERRGAAELIVGLQGAKGVLFEPFGAPASETHP